MQKNSTRNLKKFLRNLVEKFFIFLFFYFLISFIIFLFFVFFVFYFYKTAKIFLVISATSPCPLIFSTRGAF